VDGPHAACDHLTPADVARIVADPGLLAPVVATWPLDDHDGVRVVPLRPTPHYPWYAVWRTAAQHPTLPRLLRAIRAAGTRPDRGEAVWLPRNAAGPAGAGPAFTSRPAATT